MAHHVENKLVVNVSKNDIWKVLGDFSSVEKFATTIESSPIINEVKSGLGSKRLCTFQDGSSLVEEIVEFKDGHGFKMVLSEFSLPLKSMSAEMYVREIDGGKSEVSMKSDFIVKGGPLGWLMGSLMMKPMMKSVFKKLLTGLAYYSATGTEIGKKLPTSKELTPILHPSSSL
ncbi:MAG: hypothetical protein BM556_05875 [Bacteriovorax sp. MedPE-SWde]|nr:MAG: hypothetical protein BM556_05875 [Bacteriovorax sp. MedPE-SWde]